MTTKGVSERLATGLTVITYRTVRVTDHYRPGNPYLVFTSRGHSSCTVHFQVASQGFAEKVVLLSHSGTHISSGNLTTIQITIKGHEAADTSFDQVYSKSLNPDGFAQQWVQIGKFGEGRYELKIELKESSSEARYWLDDVELADFDESLLAAAI